MPRFSSAEVIIATLAPAIMAFTTSVALCTPPSAPGPFHAAVQHRDPVQAQQQLVRVAQNQVGHHLQRFQVEIRLVEAVEEHQASAPARRVSGHVGHRAEIRSQLHGHGDLDFALTAFSSSTYCSSTCSPVTLGSTGM